MKEKWLGTCMTGLALLAMAGCVNAQSKSELMPGAAMVTGGYGSASITAPDVVAAADHAIRVQAALLNNQRDAPPGKLELLAILAADQQVVAGINYRLQLKVQLDGKERNAEAIVWWQSWRPEPYVLSSWNWM